MALRTGRLGAHISEAASSRCAARHWRGRARSGGSSGEHAIKIIERDVAGASSGEAYQARTRSGGGAQLQEGGQKVYPFADWKQGARAPWENRGQIHHSVAVMRRPLRVRRIQQRALGAPRQLAEARGE